MIPTAPLSQTQTDWVAVHDEKLLKLLERYLESVETDTTFDRQRWIRRACDDHPELADEIRDGTSQIDALSFLASGEAMPTPSIAGYQIIRRLGQGGCGVVYEAIEKSLGRRVALKVFPAAFDFNTKAHARFMIEAQAAARLDHPGIVPIYAIGENPTRGSACFLSMKLIDGVSLDRCQELDRYQELDQQTNRRRSIRWIAQAADAIAEAHACGVIHRDLKPSNLLVDDNDHVWVTDFGLARMTPGDIAGPPDQVSLTQTGDRVGTMAYMSPQQAAGEPVDERTDVYSLGLTLFELITGRRAIAGQTIGEVQSLRQRTDAFHVRKFDASIPRDLDTIIAKATAGDVADRYQTAAEFAQDLRRHDRGEPIQATPPAIVTRGIKWVVRHRRSTAAIAAGLLAVTAISWVVMANLAIANRRTHEALASSQTNLRYTEKILDRFGLLAAERLRDVEGAESVRRELLKQTLLYYEDYANRIVGDDKFTEQNAITHFKAGQIIDEIGADTDAIVAYETSVRLFADAKNLSPIGVRTRGLAWNDLAVLKAESGAIDEAVSLYEQAIETLAATDLARTYGNYAVAMIEVGRETKALELIEAGLGVVQQAGDAADAMTVKSMLLSQLSFVQRKQADSLETCDRAIELLRQVQTSQDGLTSDESARMLATAIASRAAMNQNEADFRESLELMETLEVAFGHERTFLSERATRHNDLGRLLLHRSDSRSAELEFDAAEKILLRLCNGDPASDHYRVSLAGVLHNRGRANAIANEMGIARQYYDRSIELQKQLQRDSDRFPEPLRVSCKELLEQTLADVKRIK
ncbi:MAG: serine/threonine-protein kinase [Rubripirellula sp.]